MSTDVQLILPKMGESIHEATLLHWLKQPGDQVMEGEIIAEVATDKVDAEVPSAYSGILKEILVQEGEDIAIESAIAIITTSDEVAAQSTASVSTPPKEEKQAAPKEEVVVEKKTRSTSKKEKPKPSPASGRVYSPLVRSIAEKQNIDLETLERIPGTGKNARVTKDDLHRYLSYDRSVNKYERLFPAPKITSDDEVIRMDRVRKLIAERMTASANAIPQVTTFIEADITPLVEWRKKNKSSFKEKYGVGITYMPFFIKAVVNALQQYPLVNAMVMKDHIVKKKKINIGIAVALPNGNLIVPVIKQADELSVDRLAVVLKDLADRSYKQALEPEELMGATYTISNIGSFRNTMGTPLIMAPQVAIMAFGAVEKKPAVIEDENGQDQIAIRHKIHLSHTFDHRIIDGALGGEFVHHVAKYLSQFDEAKCLL